MNSIDLRVSAAPELPVGGRPITEAMQVRWSWWRSRRDRARLHTRPLLVPDARGALRLPGIGVEPFLVEAPDPYGRPCGVVLVEDTGHVSVSLALSPSSETPESETPELGGRAWAEDLGAWLALLDSEPEVVASAVVLIQDDDPTHGLRVVVQVTQRSAEFAVDGDRAAAVVEAVARVPRLVQGLDHAAVGTARPAPAAALATLVHDAYVGDPADAVETWDRLRHGGAVSQTWSLTRLPPAAVLSGLPALLTAVPPDVARTRVTLLARPCAGGASGAPDLTALVTVTAGTGDEPGTTVLPPVTAILDGLPDGLRPWLRPCYGSQAAGFAAGLPTGVLLGEHRAPPTLLAGSDPTSDRRGR